MNKYIKAVLIVLASIICLLAILVLAVGVYSIVDSERLEEERLEENQKGFQSTWLETLQLLEEERLEKENQKTATSKVGEHGFYTQRDLQLEEERLKKERLEKENQKTPKSKEELESIRELETIRKRNMLEIEKEKERSEKERPEKERPEKERLAFVNEYARYQADDYTHENIEEVLIEYVKDYTGKDGGTNRITDYIVTFFVLSGADIDHPSTALGWYVLGNTIYQNRMIDNNKTVVVWWESHNIKVEIHFWVNTLTGEITYGDETAKIILADIESYD